MDFGPLPVELSAASELIRQEDPVPAISLTPTRRELLAATAAAGALSLLAGKLRAAAGDDAIRRFTVDIPQAEIDELRRRIAATRWPDRETVNDQSQGIQLEKLRPLVEYWGSGYD